MTGGAPLPPVGAGADGIGPALDRLDGLLAEVGRRQHRFAWLRASGAPAEDGWLPVDAYYPGNRVVVCAHPDPGARELCEQLASLHGLYAAVVAPTELVGEPEQGARVLEARLRADGWVPRPAPRPAAATATFAAQASARSTPPTAPTRPANRQQRPARPQQPAAHEQRFGLGVGLVLVAIAVFEAFLGLVVLAIEDAQPILGIGLLLDACVRVAGTLSAARTGDHDTALGSLIIGSPSVVATNRSEQPLAGLAIAACACVVIGVFAAVVGA